MTNQNQDGESSLGNKKGCWAACSICLFCFSLPDMACIVLRYIAKPYPRQTGNTASRFIIIFGKQ